MMVSGDTADAKPTEFDRVLSRIHEKGWNEAGTGSVSLRVDDTEGLSIDPDGPIYALPFPAPELDGTLILMSGPGSKPSNAGLVRVNGAELSYRILRGRGPATKDLKLHLAIHRMTVLERTHMKAVVHTLPPHLIALSDLPDVREKGTINDILRKHLPETRARSFGPIARLPYTDAGASRLGYATAMALRSHDVVLWTSHSVVVVAEDLAAAFDQVNVLEQAAATFISTRSNGFGLKSRGRD